MHFYVHTIDVDIVPVMYQLWLTCKGKSKFTSMIDMQVEWLIYRRILSLMNTYTAVPSVRHWEYMDGVRFEISIKGVNLLFESLLCISILFFLLMADVSPDIITHEHIHGCT